MRNIKLVIEYDGSRYQGWQRLKTTDQTVQGKIETVISKMLEQDIQIIGSGRTDAGTHAKGQIANFHTDSNMTLQEMHKYINNYLPQDIVVKKVSEAAERFHSRYNTTGKKYTYYIWNHCIPSAFNRKYSVNIEETLDIELMKKAAKKLVGTHDFIGFSSLKKSKKSTVRTIKEINITKEGHMLKVDFIGDGFLYNMIRIIMGTLIEIGSKEKDVSCIDKVFETNTRAYAGKTLPAQGLFLEEVYY